MNLLVIVRMVFGFLSKTPWVARSVRTLCDCLALQSGQNRPNVHARLPHQWMSMDYVLIEGSTGLVYCGRGTFKKANHPLNSVFRFCRRIAWGPEPYPALATTVSLGNSRGVRR